MSKVSKRNLSKNIVTAEHLNIFKMLLLIGTMFVMFYTPYLRGLFFEPEQLVTQLVLISIFILFWVYKWLRNDRSFIKTPIDYAALGLVFAYFLSTFSAVNQRLAVSEFLKYAMYFVVFFMLSDLVNSGKEKKIMLWTIVASALGVCILGIDSIAGEKIVRVLNSLFKSIHLNINFNELFVEGRIHSTMQYPNGLASYLMGVFFITIGFAITSKRWVKCASSAISFVLLTTFIFTLSRGAYIVLILVLPLFLLLLPKGSKLKGLYCIVTLGIIGGAFSAIISNSINGKSDNSFLVWMLVIIGALISFFIRFTDDFAIKLLSKITAKIAIIGSAIIMFIVVLGLAFILNATVPLKLGHAIDEQNSYKERSSVVRLNSNEKYKLVFKVDGKSENENASFTYRIYISTANERGITTGEELAIVDKRFNDTEGIEEKEIEFTVPENSEMVGIAFQNYYSGTNVVFYEAKLIKANSGQVVKQIPLKYKYAIAANILSRFENFMSDKSFNTRILFINDGLKIFKNWWLIGAGGGAWSLLNFKYQSYLYWSTQTHNYPLQVMIETGIIGLAFLILLIVFTVINFVKIYRNRDISKTNENIINVCVFTSIVFLFLHSAIDFDFSLASIYLLAWQLIAFINSSYRENGIAKAEYIGKKKSKAKSDNRDIFERIKEKLRKGFGVYPIVMIILSIMVLIFPIRLIKAYTYTKEALDFVINNDLDKAMQTMEKAIELDYLNSEYIFGYDPIPSRQDIRIGYIDLLLRKLESVPNSSDQSSNNNDRSVLNNYIVKAQELVKKAEKYAEYNSDLCMNIGIYYLRTTEKEKAIEYISKAVDLKPLVPSQWKNKAKASYLLATNYFNQEDNKKGLEYIDKTLELINEAKKVNSNNLSPFIFDDEMQGYLEKAYYMKRETNNDEFNLDKVIFQSIFEMDIDNNNIPDQFFISNKAILDINLKNQTFYVKSKDLNQSPNIYTRALDFKVNNSYRIEVELINPEGIESIQYQITEISDVEELEKVGEIYTARFVPSTTSGNNRLVIYIKGEYEIKNVRIIKE